MATIQSTVLGYPRLGAEREIKKACEGYWAAKIPLEELQKIAKQMRQKHWQLQKNQNISLIPSNDFSLYDQVLDHILSFSAFPPRYQCLLDAGVSEEDFYFAMARGYQNEGKDLIAMEMTKWFDTNYHYIVPEFFEGQQFRLGSRKALKEYKEAKALGIETKPVLISPVSFLLLGKSKDKNFKPLTLLDSLLPVYKELIAELVSEGVQCLQFDEPALCLDLSKEAQEAIQRVLSWTKKNFPSLRLFLASYFGSLTDKIEWLVDLPIDILHLDLCRAPEQLAAVLPIIPRGMSLSLGLVDGRNIWKNDFRHSLTLIQEAQERLGNERIWVASSCSLLHCPFDLDLENDSENLPKEIKNWMAFAKQKLTEIQTLSKLASEPENDGNQILLQLNQAAIRQRQESPLIPRPLVQKRLAEKAVLRRQASFKERRIAQKKKLDLPNFPTTTIGSFPQTREIRRLRARHRRGEISAEEYKHDLEKATMDCLLWQEKLGLDVLVHGEFERNDMVEYFGEKLEGFAFTQKGWVQSYGSRGVKPPVIFGDVERKEPMTIDWARFAQSKTARAVKGMLTGPITILQWSFVRDDQPRNLTARQIALAIRDEVIDLEKIGITIINIDEPAIREGLPLRKKDQNTYLQWAIEAFRLASSAVKNETQIHTHMCYSEFHDMIQHIADMDADVLTIETSRSQMELLEVFKNFNYPNDIGPGVYDIHSPRVPSQQEMRELLKKASAYLPIEQLWVNPDCGLKTRSWEETEKALSNMIAMAQKARKDVANGVF